MSTNNPWGKIIPLLLNQLAHLSTRLPIAYLSYLNDAGFHPSSLGIPLNAYHWRKTLPDGRSIHVFYFPTQPSCYVHWDIVDPGINPIEHLRIDYPSGYQCMVGIIVTFTIFLGLYLLSKYAEDQRN